MTCALALVAALGFGCDASDNGMLPPLQPMTVTVRPTTALVPPGTTYDFDAFLQNVAPGTLLSVHWSVAGTGCTGDACGTLLVLGPRSVRYTAPLAAPVPQVVAVTATPVADPLQHATAYVTIGNANITVSVSPATGSVPVGGQIQLTATVVGDTADAGVTWSFTSSNCEIYPCGVLAPTATPSGAATTFTALDNPYVNPYANVLDIVATTVSDPTRQAFGRITITPAGTVTAKPE